MPFQSSEHSDTSSTSSIARNSRRVNDASHEFFQSPAGVSSAQTCVFAQEMHPEPATSAPAFVLLKSKLPQMRRVTIEEIADDTCSTRTFPTSVNPKMLVDDMEIDDDQSDMYDEDVADPMDDIPVPPEEDELLAPDPGSFDGDGSGYPRPTPPEDFLRWMEKEAAHPGHVCAVPSVTAAAQALSNLKLILRGESCGKSGGYKPPNFDVFVCARLEGIHAMLSYYTDPRSVTYQKWGKSALNTAIGMGRGNHCACILARLSCEYIADWKVIPLNPYGSWHWVKISIFWGEIDKKYVQNINQVSYLLFCQI